MKLQYVFYAWIFILFLFAIISTVLANGTISLCKIFGHKIIFIDNNSILPNDPAGYWICKRCAYIQGSIGKITITDYTKSRSKLCPKCKNPKAIFTISYPGNNWTIHCNNCQNSYYGEKESFGERNENT